MLKIIAVTADYLEPERRHQVDRIYFDAVNETFMLEEAERGKQAREIFGHLIR